MKANRAGSLFFTLACASAALIAWGLSLHEAIIFANAFASALNLYNYIDK